MPGRTAERSLRVKARLAGVLYLVSGVPAGFAVFLRLALIVPDNPAATASNILGSETLFRLSLVADIVSVAFVVAVTILLYDLFKPVSKNVALLAAVFGLIANAIQALASFSDLAALLFLGRASGPTSFTTAQLQELAFVLLRLHGLVFDIAVVFFGFSWIVFGYLVLGSTFLPRVIGVLVAADGVAYLISAFAVFLASPLAAQLYPFIPFGTALLGEGSLMLWFIVKGVNAQRWAEQASATTMRGAP